MTRLVLRLRAWRPQDAAVVTQTAASGAPAWPGVILLARLIPSAPRVPTNTVTQCDMLFQIRDSRNFAAPSLPH